MEADSPFMMACCCAKVNDKFDLLVLKKYQCLVVKIYLIFSRPLDIGIIPPVE